MWLLGPLCRWQHARCTESHRSGDCVRFRQDDRGRCALDARHDRSRCRIRIARCFGCSGWRGLLAAVARVAEQATDFGSVLEELLVVLHRIAIAQAVPDAVDNSRGDRERIIAYAGQFAGEDVQLFYQLGLHGRRDLPLAPDPRGGLEMTLLRMLAFKPQGIPQPPRDALGVAPRAENVPAKKLEAPAAASYVETKTSAAEQASPHRLHAPPRWRLCRLLRLLLLLRQCLHPQCRSRRCTPCPRNARKRRCWLRLLPNLRRGLNPWRQSRETLTRTVARIGANVASRGGSGSRAAASDRIGSIRQSDLDNTLCRVRYRRRGRHYRRALLPGRARGCNLSFVSNQQHASFFDPSYTQRITDQLSRVFATTVRINIAVGEPRSETPAAYRERLRLERLA